MCTVERAHLHALLCKVFTGTRLHVSGLHPTNNGLQSSINGCDSPRTVDRDVQIVGEGSRRHLQDVVWRLSIHEDLAESWDEGTRWTPGQRHTHTQYRGKSDGMAARREREYYFHYRICTASQCTASIVVSLFSWQLNWLSTVVVTTSTLSLQS